MQWINKLWIGLVIAVILPALFGLVFFHTAYKGELPFWEAVSMTAKSGLPLFGKLLLLSTFPNLGLIFLCYKAEYWNVCRGVIVVTALYFASSFFYLT